MGLDAPDSLLCHHQRVPEGKAIGKFQIHTKLSILLMHTGVPLTLKPWLHYAEAACMPLDKPCRRICPVQ